MTRRAVWLALAALLWSGGCGPAPRQAAHPALWRLADGNTTIWLLGSIHALPPTVDWQTPALRRAIASADSVILEVPPADPATARAQFLAVATEPGLPPILHRVPPAGRDTLRRATAATGPSRTTLDGWKTWAAALAIAAGAANADAASGRYGVEAVLTDRFAGRAIGALENRAGQFALFDRLPEASQRHLLIDAARDAVERGAGYRRLLGAWAAGDEAALAATLAAVRRDPAIERALLIDRNRRWASVIARRMRRPGTIIVAVGAGHLVGPGSVIALLRALGWRVERVE